MAQAPSPYQPREASASHHDSRKQIGGRSSRSNWLEFSERLALHFELRYAEVQHTWWVIAPVAVNEPSEPPGVRVRAAEFQAHAEDVEIGLIFVVFEFLCAKLQSLKHNKLVFRSDAYQ